MVDNGKPRTEADGVATYRIPSHADFLIAYRYVREVLVHQCKFPERVDLREDSLFFHSLLS